MNVQSRNPEPINKVNAPQGPTLSFQPEVVLPTKETAGKVISLNTTSEAANPAIIYLTTNRLDKEINKHSNVSVFNEKQNELLKAIRVIVETNKYEILEKGNLNNGDTIELGKQLQIMTDHNQYATAA